MQKGWMAYTCVNDHYVLFTAKRKYKNKINQDRGCYIINLKTPHIVDVCK